MKTAATATIYVRCSFEYTHIHNIPTIAEYWACVYGLALTKSKRNNRNVEKDAMAANAASYIHTNIRRQRVSEWVKWTIEWNECDEWMETTSTNEENELYGDELQQQYHVMKKASASLFFYAWKHQHWTKKDKFNLNLADWNENEFK